MKKRSIILMLIIILILQVLIPLLTIVKESPIASVVNAEDLEVYYINTAQDMWDFAKEVNSGNTFEGVTVYLENDINLECSEDKQWEPIGDYSTSSNYKFAGIFCGNDKKISGIYINSEEEYQGLFGYNEGTISNIVIEGKITSFASYCGSIAGLNNGKIMDCKSYVKINGGDNSGGICGRNYGDIVNCNNYGEIIECEQSTEKPTGGIGGICGYNSGNVETTYNYGKIIGNESQGLLSGVGGIVGYNSGKIYLCNNEADIENKSYTGGIVGYNCKKIIKCNNTGNISGSSYLGGCVGKNDYGSKNEGYAIVSQCTNSGEIKGTASYVGGVVGMSGCSTKEGRAVVIKCSNTGNIQGSMHVGRSMWNERRWEWRRY